MPRKKLIESNNPQIRERINDIIQRLVLGQRYTDIRIYLMDKYGLSQMAANNSIVQVYEYFEQKSDKFDRELERQKGVELRELLKQMTVSDKRLDLSKKVELLLKIDDSKMKLLGLMQDQKHYNIGIGNSYTSTEFNFTVESKEEIEAGILERLKEIRQKGNGIN